jgi:hypothetical protein
LFKKKSEDGRNYLEIVPVWHYPHEEESDGKVSVLVPRFTNKYLVKHLAPRLRSPYVKAKLDEFGSQVWLEINGENNVQIIAENLVKKFGDRIQPVHQRLTKFLTQLYTYNFIKFKDI